MPGSKKHFHHNPHQQQQATSQPVVKSGSLLATDAERHATSKSLYGDNKARISANVWAINERLRTQPMIGAIQQCMKGKTVLHLACGMGLLSMIAARANAKHVVAVDNSVIVDAAAIVAKQNSLTNVTFLRGTIQEVEPLLPVKKFDVIICEWMGAFLTNEAVLRDLLWCKENLLEADGFVCPNQSSVHVVGVSDYNYYTESIDYWDNVYGFSMKAMKPLVAKEASTCPIPRQCIATNSGRAHTVSIEQFTGPVSMAALSYSAPFAVKATLRTTIHFLSFYIDSAFMNPVDPGANFVIGFNPGGGNAWTEVSVTLPEAVPVEIGETIIGMLHVTPKGKATEVKVEYKCEGAAATVEGSEVYTYVY